MIGFAPAARLLHASADHCLCQNSCGCGAVTCNVIGLCCNFFYQLCTHILESIFQLDLFCDGHTIVGDQRSTKGFIQSYVTSLGSKGYSERYLPAYSTPASSAARASAPYLISFAIINQPPNSSLNLRFDYCQNVMTALQRYILRRPVSHQYLRTWSK